MLWNSAFSYPYITNRYGKAFCLVLSVQHALFGMYALFKRCRKPIKAFLFRCLFA